MTLDREVPEKRRVDRIGGGGRPRGGGDQQSWQDETCVSCQCGSLLID
jgi:hypothetical protein